MNKNFKKGIDKKSFKKQVLNVENSKTHSEFPAMTLKKF